MLLAVAVLLAGAGLGGYFLGRSGGADLHRARLLGERLGAAQGTRVGQKKGYELGYRLGYRHAYRHAYRASYATAFRGASK